MKSNDKKKLKYITSICNHQHLTLTSVYVRCKYQPLSMSQFQEPSKQSRRSLVFKRKVCHRQQDGLRMNDGNIRLCSHLFRCHHVAHQFQHGWLVVAPLLHQFFFSSLCIDTHQDSPAFQDIGVRQSLLTGYGAKFLQQLAAGHGLFAINTHHTTFKHGWP